MMYACNANTPYTGCARGNVGDLGFAAVQGLDLCDGGGTRKGAPAGREGPLREPDGARCHRAVFSVPLRSLRTSTDTALMIAGPDLYGDD